jgi:hypothetical protein
MAKGYTALFLPLGQNESLVIMGRFNPTVVYNFSSGEQGNLMDIIFQSIFLAV